MTSAASAGCHVLLRRRGTQLISRAEEIIEIVGKIGELADDPDHPGTPLDGLRPGRRRWYSTRRCRHGVCAASSRSRVDAGVLAEAVLGPLALLEIAGSPSAGGTMADRAQLERYLRAGRCRACGSGVTRSKLSPVRAH